MAPKAHRTWRVLKHAGTFAIVDSTDDLIADCYTTATDAMTMAASRELRKAADDLVEAESPQEWGAAWIALRNAARMAREGDKR